ncbi:hypothetical protein D3C84_870860 [compost metagenome]
MLLQLVLDLEIRLAHLHEGLGIVAAGDHAAVIVAQHNDGHAGQVRAEHSFATGVEAVAIDQGKNRLGFRHGCARCR